MLPGALKAEADEYVRFADERAEDGRRLVVLKGAGA